MDTCVINLLNNVYREVNDGGVCGVLFIDLAKAFDTVDHTLLWINLVTLDFALLPVLGLDLICLTDIRKLVWAVIYRAPGR